MRHLVRLLDFHCSTESDLRFMAEPLAAHALHHIALPTRDPEVTCDFYVRVLGLKRIARPAFSFAGAWLYHPPAQIQIHLIEHSSARGERGSIDTLAPHLAMRADDLDVIEERLKQHKIPYERQINAAGFQQIFFQDPDGNCLELGIYPEDMETN
ncbi:MAG: VOC family protein [Pirellulales bacterium]|nr:VOC family protein [Pirellulales bacterium]